ncbi:MAG: calcium/sodium antiporter [Planctomycetaceae bacterium]
MNSLLSDVICIADGMLPILLGNEPAGAVWGVLVVIVVSLAAITKGGDLFTDASVSIAHTTRIPPAIVGATIVSTATSFPEFMVSLTGVFAGSTEFAVGNVVGSCLCNIGLIVGLCAVLPSLMKSQRGTWTGLFAERSMLQGPGMFMLFIAVLTCVFALFGSTQPPHAAYPYDISRWKGVVLLLGLLWYILTSIRSARTARRNSAAEMLPVPASADDFEPVVASGLLKTAVIFVLACGMVVIGSRLLVTNGEALALRFGVPKLILGLTLFAIGTSLPELTVSLMAVLKGHQDLGIGNVVGSNIVNICWVLATCATVETLPVAAQTALIDLPVVLLLSVMLVAIPWKSGTISPRAGWALLSIYLLHVVGVSLAGMAAGA